MATETNERKMWPWTAGTMSSQKFSEIQSHSMSLGSSSDERSCKSARPASPTREFLNGVYVEQPLLAALLVGDRVDGAHALEVSDPLDRSGPSTGVLRPFRATADSPPA